MKFEGNILGKMRQQIGKSFVFSIWKGIQTAKQYAIPSNPRTPAQVAQRALFKAVLFVMQLYSIAQINIYWRKFAVKMSAFNAAMQANLNAMFPTFDATKLVFSKGSLTATAITSATYEAVTGNVRVSFSTGASGNQLATDYMIAIIYNTEVPGVFVSDGTAQRSDGVINYTIPTGLDFGRCSAYLFAFRNLGASNEAISDNSYHAVAEP